MGVFGIRGPLGLGSTPWELQNPGSPIYSHMDQTGSLGSPVGLEP